MIHNAIMRIYVMLVHIYVDNIKIHAYPHMR